MDAGLTTRRPVADTDGTRFRVPGAGPVAGKLFCRTGALLSEIALGVDMLES